MPIKIHDNLPARKLLQNEIVDVIDSSAAEKQDIRPLKFLLLNLMPKKLETEVQFARLLGASPLQIELTLMTTETYSPKNTRKEHLIEFYKTLDDIKNNFYDVLIITGAPVEIVPFNEVKYWDELKKIILWSKNITSKYCVVESAILFESGLNKLCNKIICVEAPEKIRIQRIIKRDKINKESIIKRFNNQTKLKSHIKSIDYFIKNIDFDETKKNVITIHNKLFN